jgi:hypothetical protein
MGTKDVGKAIAADLAAAEKAAAARLKQAEQDALAKANEDMGTASTFLRENRTVLLSLFGIAILIVLAVLFLR